MIFAQAFLYSTTTLTETTQQSLAVSWDFYWGVNESATASWDFYWGTGTQRQYWYRVLGQPKIDVCNPLGGDGCCKTLLMTIMASNVGEICQKIQSRFGVVPLQSIQVFSIPAETAAVAADAAAGITYTCNQLTDVPFCNVPLCAAFCVDYAVQEYWGTYDVTTLVSSVGLTEGIGQDRVQMLSMHEADGGIRFGGYSVCQLNINAPVSRTKIRVRGGVAVESCNYHFDGTGGFHVGGSAERGATHYTYQGGDWARNIKVTKFDIHQTGYGTPWHIEEVFTNNMADGPSCMLVFSNFQADIPESSHVTGVVFSFDRFANGLVRDAEVVTMSGNRILRTLTKPYDYPFAIPVSITYGNGDDALGFVPGKLFAIGIRIRPVVLREGLLAQISKPKMRLVCDTGGIVRIGGSASVNTSFWEHEARGGVTAGGSAHCVVATKKKPRVEPKYSPAFTPKVQIQGLSKGKIEPLVRALGAIGPILISESPTTPVTQSVVPVLSLLSNTVNQCLCTSMPLLLPFSQNMATGNNKFAQFAQRNGITVPQYINIEYKTINDSWQANLHYQGNSASTLNAETWNLVFEFQCTSLLGGTQIGKNVWKFAIKINQRNSITNEILETRLVVAFVPDVICANGQQFQFQLTYDTQMQVATIDPVSTIYEMVFYDSIGLFKTAYWVTNPNLIINMTQSSIPSPVPTYPLYIQSYSLP